MTLRVDKCLWLTLILKLLTNSVNQRKKKGRFTISLGIFIYSPQNAQQDFNQTNRITWHGSWPPPLCLYILLMLNRGSFHWRAEPNVHVSSLNSRYSLCSSSLLQLTDFISSFWLSIENRCRCLSFCRMLSVISQVCDYKTHLTTGTVTF